jgi:hypothetical protein
MDGLSVHSIAADPSCSSRRVSCQHGASDSLDQASRMTAVVEWCDWHNTLPKIRGGTPTGPHRRRFEPSARDDCTVRRELFIFNDDRDGVS